MRRERDKGIRQAKWAGEVWEREKKRDEEAKEQ